MVFAEKFADLNSQETFNHLLNENIVEDIRNVVSNNSSPSCVLIEKNFTTDTHKVILTQFPDNGHFDSRLLELDLFKNICLTDHKVFSNGTLIEKIYSFNTLALENSYDELLTTRDSIKTVFDTWNPYYKRFLDSVLKCFDGESENFLSDLSFSCDGWGQNYNPSFDGKFNRLICHEYPDAQLDRDVSIIKKLCNLYKITETDQDNDDLDLIIEKITPILSKENLKINYKLTQSKLEYKEFEIIIHPIVHEFRNDVFVSTLKCLHENFDLNIDVIKQLSDWENDERLFGFISLRLVKKDNVELEIVCSYGTL
jgi:DNA-binding cell septation regulator SpoVG